MDHGIDESCLGIETQFILIMSTDSFEKSNWGWHLSQFQQQVSEWVELQFSQFESAPKGNGYWIVELIKILFWLLLGVFLIWLCWRMWQIVKRYPLKTGANVVTAKIHESDLSVAIWVQRSQEYLRQHNYREACRCLYMAMLQRLSDTGIAPHQHSRTDGEYSQLLQHLPSSQSYQTLIKTHEQLFGSSEISPETFARCQQAYRDLGKV